MKNLLRYFVIIPMSLLCFASCSDDELFRRTLEECEILKNFEIIREDEKSSVCIYNNVFRYQSEIYTICECCVCDKEYYIIDCDGNLFYEDDDDYSVDFYQNAVYLFAVKSK